MVAVGLKEMAILFGFMFWEESQNMDHIHHFLMQRRCTKSIAAKFHRGGEFVASTLLIKVDIIMEVIVRLKKLLYM